MRRAVVLARAGCAIALASAVGCGSGNDADDPSHSDVDLASASTDISLYCLEKTEGSDDAELNAAVDELARVYREDPEASYETQQGRFRPAREVLEDAATDLHECGEHEAAGELERALDAGP